ncbi:hypothetical protein BKK56_03860 [Rodentibacter genomosp. 2]|uniref:hypothetical protein n=1 Tax=Rodentibacter genomosp. 2 TaxID=1908266 RepID=UPI00098624D8|nr:hypothetical protein BKK56_03860 [Rodentibacter genomosp. 2]
MARVNKNQPVDSMFAYNVAKDIANLENEVEKLKKDKEEQPEVPKSNGIEFGKSYHIKDENFLFREVLNSNAIMIQTGYFANELWHGDRPDDGIWYNPINNERYIRKNGVDEKLVLPDFDLSTLQNYITSNNAYSYYGFTPIYDGEKGTGQLVINLDFEIPSNFNFKSIPELKIKLKGYDELKTATKDLLGSKIAVSVGAQFEVNLSDGTENFEFEILDDKSNVVYTGSHTVEFADVDSAIKNAKFEFSEPKKTTNNFIIPAPTIKTNDDNIKPSFIMRKVEYRLNGKVQRGIVQEPQGTIEPYIFSADTAEELQGSVEVWYKGEQIQ